MLRHNRLTASWVDKLLLNIVVLVCLPLLPFLWFINKILRKRMGLLDAAAIGDVDRIKSLLDEGAAIHSVDEHGRTALHCALDDGALSAAAFLMEQGADLQLPDACGRTALDLVRTIEPGFIMEDEKGWWNCKEFLLRAQIAGPEYSLDWIINQKMHKSAPGNPDSHYDCTGIVSCILNVLMRFSLWDRFHRLSLHDAASVDKIRSIRRILRKGADIHSLDNYGRTALHCALDETSLRAAAFLMKQGSDVNLADAYGRTPLDIVKTISPITVYWDERGWRELKSCLEEMGEIELAHSQDKILGLE